ncbi:hypothetical protein RB195_000628 [Necator americanus]|uniref:Uncharacterized protein n=1 Tax=Necator americanus TaxID=51031 RepID=A0ABR1DAM1_NECAM
MADVSSVPEAKSLIVERFFAEKICAEKLSDSCSRRPPSKRVEATRLLEPIECTVVVVVGASGGLALLAATVTLVVAQAAQRSVARLLLPQCAHCSASDYRLRPLNVSLAEALPPSRARCLIHPFFVALSPTHDVYFVSHLCP